MSCSRCGIFDAERSAILRGEYYEDICNACYQQLQDQQRPSSGQASYNRQRDLEDHLADVIQPYSGGKPSRDFMRLYPDRARQLFTDEQMRAAERNG